MRESVWGRENVFACVVVWDARYANLDTHRRARKGAREREEEKDRERN